MARNVAPLELRAMAPRQINGPSDPPSTNLSVKATLRHMFEVGLTTNALTAVTSTTLFGSLPGSSGWSSYRLIKVSVYNPGAPALSATASPFVAIQMPGDTGFSDANSQTFIDHGMYGALCPNIHVQPAFAQRQRWYSSSSTDTLFNVAASITGTAGVVLIHATVELQSASQTPAFLR